MAYFDEFNRIAPRTYSEAYAEALNAPAPQITQESVNEAIANSQPQQPPKDGAAIANEQTEIGINQGKADYNAQQQEAQRQSVERQLAVLTDQLAAQLPQNWGALFGENPYAPGNQYAQSSTQYYDDAYNYLRNKGYSEEASRDAAQREANRYRADRLGYIQAAMATPGIGIDERGIFTPIGTQLLYQMQNEDPESAALYANAYSMPKVGTNYLLDIAKGDHSAQNALEKAITMAGVNYDYGQRGADADLARRMAMADYQNSLQQAALMQQAGYASQLAYKQAVQDALQGGATPEQADAIGKAAGQQAYLLAMSGGGGYGSGGRGGRGSGRGSASQDQMKWLEERIKFTRENGMNNLGEWDSPMMEQQYNSLLKEYNRILSGEPELDSRNPDHVLRVAQNLSNQYGIPIEQTKAIIEQMYPDADTSKIPGQPSAQAQPQEGAATPQAYNSSGLLDDIIGLIRSGASQFRNWLESIDTSKPIFGEMSEDDLAAAKERIADAWNSFTDSEGAKISYEKRMSKMNAVVEKIEQEYKDKGRVSR